jgi:hypothetical protein
LGQRDHRVRHNVERDDREWVATAGQHITDRNFAAMAAAAPGKYYANLVGTDPLFDNYP